MNKVDNFQSVLQTSFCNLERHRANLCFFQTSYPNFQFINTPF